MPRVTVLLPVFNAMPHLQYAVESLHKQTLKDFRVVVIDDGSNDASPDFLDKINDERFTVIHQKNSGLAVTLNRMLPIVDTEYVARMDADDISLPQRLEKQLEFMDSHSEIAVAGSRAGYIAGRKSAASIGLGKWRMSLSYSPPMSNPPYWHPGKDGNILAHTSVIMRTEYLRNVGGYPEIVPGQDLALWFRFTEAGYKLASMDDMLVLFRLSPGGISGGSLALQARTWAYLSYRHKQHMMGLQAPSMEEYFVCHPETDDQTTLRVRKARLRNAGALILEGSLFPGLCMLWSVLRDDPGLLLDKLRKRGGVTTPGMGQAK